MKYTGDGVSGWYMLMNTLGGGGAAKNEILCVSISTPPGPVAVRLTLYVPAPAGKVIVPGLADVLFAGVPLVKFHT